MWLLQYIQKTLERKECLKGISLYVNLFLHNIMKHKLQKNDALECGYNT
jgi:hypothetical protein